MGEFRKLLRQIEEFRGDLERCAEKCEREVERLRDGLCPSDGLAERLKDANRRFLHLREQVLTLAQIEPEALPRSLARLAGILKEARSRRSRLHEQIAELGAILARVAALHCPRGEIQGLEEVHRHAAELERSGGAAEGELPAEALAVLRSDHPLVALLRLVEDPDTLSLADYEESYDRVAEAYGRNVATAAMRRWLAGGARESRPSPPPASAVEEPVEEAAAVEEPAPEEEPTPAPPEPVAEEPPPPPAEPEPEEEPEPVPAADGPREPEEEAPPPPEPESITEEPAPLPAEPVAEEPEVGQPPPPAPSSAPPPQRSLPADATPRAAFWTALSEGRLGLAYHLAAALHASEDGHDVPSPSVIAVHSLSPFLHSATGPLAERIAAEVDRLTLTPDDTTPPLLWASLLSPALLLPPGAAGSLLLEAVSGGEDAPFAQLSEMLVELTKRLGRVDANLLKGADAEASWRRELAEVQARATEWLETAPERSTKFPRATTLWRQWTRDGGRLHDFVAVACSEDRAAVARADALARELSDVRHIRKLVREDDPGRRARKDEEIHSGALRQIEQMTQHAVEIVNCWLDVLRRFPRTTDPVTHQLGRFRQTLEELRPDIEERLRLLREADDEETRVVGARATASFSAFLELFRLDDDDAAEPAATEVLNTELLAVSGLELDEEGRPDGPPAEVARTLMEAVFRPEDWGAALTARAERGDIAGAERVREILAAEGRDDGTLADLLERARRERRKALDVEIEELRRDLNSARARGAVTEAERVELEAGLTDVERRLPGEKRLNRSEAAIRGICERLARLQDEAGTDLERRIAETEAAAAPESVARLRDVARQGQILLANEYLSLLEAGKALPLPAEAVRDSFEEFFPGKLEEIAEFLASGVTGEKLIKLVEKGKLPFNTGPRPNRDHLARSSLMLDAWLEAERRREIDQEQQVAIFRGLGFEARVDEFVRCEPLTERILCPLPLYGSRAQGEYRLICLWDSRSEEEILAKVGDTAPERRPCIVFSFAPLGVLERRELARLCRARRRTFLLVDKPLLLHLCGEPAPRVSAFFRCALPFTYNEPYVTSSGFVHTEMFFGRNEELQSLLNFEEQRCFVYGGRQLGKTALLREATRRFHDPENEKYALWFEIGKLGPGREPRDIWMRLDPELRRLGVFGDDGPAEPDPEVRGRVEAYVAALRDWTLAKPERRFLLLLDEADDFLGNDLEQQYVEAARLRGLMYRTDRHFKVVLAGLHDVVRTVDLSNHPLAHFGKPFRIGPFSGDRDTRDAVDLVRVPLESLGYRFESEDLVMRILAQSNYYPSLIQIYCLQLLRKLNDPEWPLIDYRTGPPYTITWRHLQEINGSGELADEIRHRLRLTLQLDKRYEVIAYSVIHILLESKSALAEGIHADRIRTEAAGWWSEGFEGTSRQKFGSLLSEMEDLGVLRHTGEQRYTLRNPNILNLLGASEEQIADELLKRRQPPVKFRPEIFHSYMKRAEEPRRHPLTLWQEGVLHRRQYRVSFVFGVPAAGLDYLPEAILLRERKEHLTVVGDRDGIEVFRERLEELSARQADRTLVLVSHRTEWDPEWVEAAQRKLKLLRAEARPVRVLFLVEPGRARWHLGDLDELAGDRSDWLTLEPWDPVFVRQWLEEVGLATDAAEDVYRTTGGWPGLLEELYERTRSELRRFEERRRELEAELAGEEWREGFLAWFGLASGPGAKLLRSAVGLTSEGERIVPDTLPLVAEGAGLGEEEARTALDRAELLRLVSTGADGSWRVDPVVRRILGG